MSVLSSAAWQSFCINFFVFTHSSSMPDFCFPFLCFVFPFSSCCRFPCVHLHLTPSVFIPILVTDKKHRIVFFAIVDDISFLEINNFQECNTSYVGINPYSILFLLLGSEITKVNFTIHLLWALTEERDS